MKAIQFALIGLKNSGKTTIAKKLKQKDEIKTEKISVYSFKQGGTLVYIADTPYNINEPKEMIALLKESDGCIFCISAEEGINQRIGELILLINFLDIKNGVVVITKIDTKTPDEISSLKNKLKTILSDSTLKDAKILETSALTDEGFNELREELIKMKQKERFGEKLKIPIETSNEIKRGLTSVYGIIDSGKIKKYDKVIIMPWGKEFIVQEINLHGEIVESAKTGDRVGILFKGLYPWDIQTGDVVTTEGVLEKSKNLKLEIEITKFFKDEIRTKTEVLLNIGLQTFSVLISKILKEGVEVDSVKGGDKVEIYVQSKLPFAFEKNQKCILINPEAHWRSINLVGSGIVKEGL